MIKLARDLNDAYKRNETFKGISEEKFKSDIKHSFTFLNRIDTSVHIGKGKLRFMRLFLLVTNLIKENSFVDIEFLALINTKLSIINDKAILIDEDKRNTFTKELIDLKILNDASEFTYFIKLSDLFSKTKKINDDHLTTIIF